MKRFAVALAMVSAFVLGSASPALASYGFQCGVRPIEPPTCDRNSAQCVCFVDKDGNKTCGWIFDCS